VALRAEPFMGSEVGPFIGSESSGSCNGLTGVTEPSKCLPAFLYNLIKLV